MRRNIFVLAEEYPDTESGIRIESLDVVSVPDGVEKGYIVGSIVLQGGRREYRRSPAVDITKTEKALCGMCEGQRKDPDRRTGPVCV